MAVKRSKAPAGKGVNPATRWGVHLMMGVLLAVVSAGAASQLLAAFPSPPPDSAAAVSTASQAANVAGASNPAGASSSVRTLYVYGDQLRPLVEETNGVQTLNIYGPGGQIIAQVVRDGQGGQEVRYLLADHLGSTRAVLDADGNAVARFEYGPYGETTASGTAAADVRYRYTGHPYDEAQGVYETPARGYDPTLGRFLSVDPQREDASPYVYAGNNPVNLVDPTGDIRVPFFIVPDQLASTHVSATEAVLELFGRLRTGTDHSMTQYSEMYDIAGHGNFPGTWYDARPVLTDGHAGLARSSRAFIFVDQTTTSRDVRKIFDGMIRLKDLARTFAGEDHDSLFEDVTIISTHAGWSRGQDLFSRLHRGGFARVRAFMQAFVVTPPAQRGETHQVTDIVVPELLQDHNARAAWHATHLSREQYIRMMGLEPPDQTRTQTVDGPLDQVVGRLQPLLEIRPQPLRQPQHRTPPQLELDAVVPEVIVPPLEPEY